jgi:hypothetical protein
MNVWPEAVEKAQIKATPGCKSRVPALDILTKRSLGTGPHDQVRNSRRLPCCGILVAKMGAVESIFSRLGGIAMQIVLDPPIEKPQVLLSPTTEISQATLGLPRHSEPLVDSGSNPGLSLDGLLIWICMSWGLLLLGMHVYELLLGILR